MKIHVAILTCDRVDLTRITVDSFLKHNDRARFSIKYGDDASTNQGIHELMRDRNIECVVRNRTRLGCSPTSEALVNAVSKDPWWRIRSRDLLLYLQNDFESVRPIDLELIDRIFRDPRVGWVRLFGEHKNDRVIGGNPAITYHRQRPGRPDIEWERYDIGQLEELQIADAPYSLHPTIVRRNLARSIFKDAKSELDTLRNADRLGVKCVRFMRNVTNHIGIGAATPGGLYGKSSGSFHAESKST